MVWPIIRGESYVGETGKSMKAVELALSRRSCCCNIPITLIDPHREGLGGGKGANRRRKLVLTPDTVNNPARQRKIGLASRATHEPHNHQNHNNCSDHTHT